VAVALRQGRQGRHDFSTHSEFLISGQVFGQRGIKADVAAYERCSGLA
jgi:hypothetical protein